MRFWICARYARAIDGGDDDGWSDCFATAGIPEIPALGTSLQGRVSLRAFAIAHRDSSNRSKHATTNIMPRPPAKTLRERRT
ncbi:nuclear transport factor 2 family protein [Rhodococcus sp. 27YEA15]|uniref:nuclear transport factor 2 family protein n=1 Tax=Rhodococcus sp. 27YEA15 TaxID=3156259 RepID=UPI003C7D8AD2